MGKVKIKGGFHKGATEREALKSAMELPTEKGNLTGLMKEDNFCRIGRPNQEYRKEKDLEDKLVIREVYDRMADHYDSLKHGSRFLIEKAEGKTIQKWLKILSPPTLDVGCGTGRYTISIARTIENSMVSALDISEIMLKKVVEKIRTGRCHNIFPVLADGEYLPFKDESFNSLIMYTHVWSFQKP